MNLSHYLQILWRRRLIVIVTALAATITVAVGIAARPQEYTSSATIRIPTATSGSRDYVEYELSYSDRIINTYVKLATSGSVLDELQNRLDIPESQLPAITAKAITDTELLELTVQSPDPKLAQNAANVLADILMNQRTPGSRLSIVQLAEFPEPPGLIEKVLWVILGLVVGGLGGAGLAFLYDGIDMHVHTGDEIASLAELPVLAALPVARRGTKPETLADVYPHRESFVRLGANILANRARIGGAMSIVVTSANPQEGKSTIVANLALTIARTGQHVILIDADMRRPTLHAFFGHSRAPGLSELLTRQCKLKDALQPTSTPNLDLIAGGQTPADPDVLLGSDTMRELIETLKSKLDMILIDTPAYLAVADAVALTMLVDGVILVVSRGDVRRKDILEIRRELTATNANLLGVVINRAEYDVPRPYRNYYQPSE